MKGNAVFLSNTDDWRTPREIYDYYMNNGYIDPCPFQCETDNLQKDWGGG